MKHGMQQSEAGQPARRRKNLRHAVAPAGSPKRRGRKRRAKPSPDQEPDPLQDAAPKPFQDDVVETVSDEASEVHEESSPADAQLRDVLDS